MPGETYTARSYARHENQKADAEKRDKREAAILRLMARGHSRADAIVWVDMYQELIVNAKDWSSFG